MNSIRKISARVFCQLHGGGNPVSVFVGEAIEKSLQSKLASSCAWESVMVETVAVPRLSFFLPTGEEVSFCAHAAIGGLSQLLTTLESPTTFVTAAGEIFRGTVVRHDGNSLLLIASFKLDSFVLTHSSIMTTLYHSK